MREERYKKEYLRYAREFNSQADLAGVLNRSSSYIASRMSVNTDKYFSGKDIEMMEAELERRKQIVSGTVDLTEDQLQDIARRVLQMLISKV